MPCSWYPLAGSRYETVNLNGGVGHNKLGPPKGKLMSIWMVQSIQSISLPHPEGFLLFTQMHRVTRHRRVDGPHPHPTPWGRYTGSWSHVGSFQPWTAPAWEGWQKVTRSAVRQAVPDQLYSFWPAHSMTTATESCLESIVLCLPVKYPVAVPGATAEGRAGGCSHLCLALLFCSTKQLP